jgi:hypothetical protein
VNLSFFLSLATCRMRSSACDTLIRSRARHVLCWLAFPSAPALGSTGSAADCSALFAGFSATTTESDFRRSCITADGSSPSRCGPPTGGGQTWDLPVPVQGASAHARVFDHVGPVGRSRLSCPVRVAFRPDDGVGARDLGFFRGSMAGPCASLPTLHPRPCRRRRTCSGPVWVAAPSLQRTFTSYSLPVSRRTIRKLSQTISVRQPRKFSPGLSISLASSRASVLFCVKRGQTQRNSD